MTERRYLVLHLPQLATDRLRQAGPGLCGQPLACWATVGNRRLLTAVDAPGTALHAGQALADAQAMHPELVLRPAEPAADLALLERLALWALRFTPLASADPPDGLVLDITGCTGLFGGEAPLLARVTAGLGRSGIAARAVIANVVDVAAALARAGRHGVILPPGKERAVMEGLPLSVLRLPPDCLAGLHRLDLQDIGDVLRQPRAPLSRRFGRQLLDVLDAITGERPRPLSPVRPPPEYSAVGHFVDPIVTRADIDRAVDSLLDRLCQKLAGAGQGARRITLRAFRVDGDVQELTIGTGLPTRTPAHLRRLFGEVLGRLEPDLGFERLTLQADSTNPLVAAQDGMGAISPGGHRAEEALGQLLDRLGQRLPVWRLDPVESHWPERAVREVDPFAPVPRDGAWPGLAQPVRLLPRPVPLMVVAGVPDGPPTRIRLDGAMHAVLWAEGPDRIEAEWWREPEERPGRDYYRVALATGARLWIGRAGPIRPDKPARWFLHGYLA
ncbi:Y-family DNA polymerase [Roseomonas mucosa]|uniref:Y-family DNA polymerase n=2 Tax=Roseomonas TaxID=125216 RepID=UPI001EF412D6|nr:DNA polymerase Y family protein [Roseomonas mucosa]MCG7352621.1 DNA polymerase Y family protein [Roseomonas mucosa]MCG7358259.1 DNA polymerase Y family protein [Roseomonas mucosa]